MSFQLTTMTERPDLWSQAEALIGANWPVFLQQDKVSYQYWSRLYIDFPDYQLFLLTADGNTLVAVGNCIPLAWDGAPEDLPDEGWRWTLAQGFQDAEAGRPTKNLFALSITLNTEFLGLGVSTLVVQAMKDTGKKYDLTRIVAPIRPNLKNRYPLIPMQEYITWRNADGLPFDAWIRVHYRLGSRVVKVCPSSMRINGSVADWENWLGLRLPQSGQYLANGGLKPIEINVEKDSGVYIEPNVWMIGTCDGNAPYSFA
ncbi:MAG TPA: GNAT family N-acetyltransferase [Anaerolineae bacterium]|nr:GNAT family N-acetyltransferase [Anaerolineae bacterium]